jgi:opacity protein-like surface antigen
MNKKILLTAVLAGIFGYQAQAATPPHSGFSVGVNLGHTSVDGKLNRAFAAPVADNSNLGARSPVLGLFLGYGWAAGSPGVYLGGEIFGQIENMKAKREDFINLANFGLTTRLESKNTFGAAAKIGYVCKEMVFFGKIGVTTTKWKFNFENASQTAQNTSINSRKMGFLLGIGMDYAIAKNWTIGGEYIYTMYRSLKLNIPETALAVPATFDYKPKVSTFNLRLKFTF